MIVRIEKTVGKIIMVEKEAKRVSLARKSEIQTPVNRLRSMQRVAFAAVVHQIWTRYA